MVDALKCDRLVCGKYFDVDQGHKQPFKDRLYDLCDECDKALQNFLDGPYEGMVKPKVVEDLVVTPQLTESDDSVFEGSKVDSELKKYDSELKRYKPGPQTKPETNEAVKKYIMEGLTVEEAIKKNNNLRQKNYTKTFKSKVKVDKPKHDKISDEMEKKYGGGKEVKSELARFNPRSTAKPITIERITNYIKDGMKLEEARKKAHLDNMRDKSKANYKSVTKEEEQGTIEEYVPHPNSKPITVERIRRYIKEGMTLKDAKRKAQVDNVSDWQKNREVGIDKTISPSYNLDKLEKENEYMKKTQEEYKSDTPKKCMYCSEDAEKGHELCQNCEDGLDSLSQNGVD